jgi:hypothetical protein
LLEVLEIGRMENAQAVATGEKFARNRAKDFTHRPILTSILIFPLAASLNESGNLLLSAASYVFIECDLGQAFVDCGRYILLLFLVAACSHGYEGFVDEDSLIGHVQAD